MKLTLSVNDSEVTSLDDADRKVKLSEFAAALQQARGYRTIDLAWQEMIDAAASRVGQLYRYANKRRKDDATFRPYAPLKVSETERGKVKRAAAAEGVATVKDAFPWRCTERDARGRRCAMHRHETGDHSFL